MASNIVKFRFLTAAQVVRLQNNFMKGHKPTQPAMLESAVQSPMNIKYYTIEQNVFQLAATLSEKFIKNHAFQDGNKRTALLEAKMFLKINGYGLPPQEPTDEKQPLLDALVAVCVNKWTAEQLGQYYQEIATEDKELTPEELEIKIEATEC